MCRFRVLARLHKLGLGSRKVCMNRVTFSDTDEVREYNPEDNAADPLPPVPAEQTLTGKRGRPPKPVESLSPLQLAEKRMKTAEETYHGEKYNLFTKVIELKDKHAWHDHPSVVARLNERLDTRCRKVVALQSAAEDAKLDWEFARKQEAVERSDKELEMLEEIGEARKEIERHIDEKLELFLELKQTQENFAKFAEARERIESYKAQMAANEAELAADGARERVLWLRGFI